MPTDEEVEAAARALHEHESDILAAHNLPRRAAWEKQRLSLQDAERNRAIAVLTAAERVRSLNAEQRGDGGTA